MEKFKLAIVENDEDERHFMVEAFNNFGAFEMIGVFWNGDQLLDWLGSAHNTLPQLIITDLNMPGKNGYDVICEVNALYPEIRVIATSTSTIPATRDKCISLGALDFMLKPDVFIAYDTYAEQVYNLLVSLGKQRDNPG